MWIHVRDEKPQQNTPLWYFFEHVGVHLGEYLGDDVFAGDGGFLGGDVTHWQYHTGQQRPEPPEGFQ